MQRIKSTQTYVQDITYTKNSAEGYINAESRSWKQGSTFPYRFQKEHDPTNTLISNFVPSKL